MDLERWRKPCAACTALGEDADGYPQYCPACLASRDAALEANLRQSVADTGGPCIRCGEAPPTSDGLWCHACAAQAWTDALPAEVERRVQEDRVHRFLDDIERQTD